MNTFKKIVCKNLKLVRAEITFVAIVKLRQQQLVFQLPSEALPLLRHCTGWRKDWLFSLDVSGVQVSGEDRISVQELKISQLRLQEDPGTTQSQAECRVIDASSLMNGIFLPVTFRVRLDHGVSKEPTNPLWARIHWFL